MKIVKNNNGIFSYGLESQFTPELLVFCQRIRNSVGAKEFNWEKDSKLWGFNKIEIVEMIKNRFPSVELDPGILLRYEMYQTELELDVMKVAQAEVIKNATDSNIEIKNVKGELYPYQKVGVEFFINNRGRAILADTMGLGKTLQSLAYVAHTGHSKTLVVCPASMKYTWEAEAIKWTKLKPFVITTKDVLDIDSYNKHDVFVINYDILKKNFKALSALRFDCMVCDEFHYIKNRTAQRTKAIMALATKIPHILLLSGTPMLSRPIELYTGLKIMDPFTWGDYRGYSIRYCDGHQGYWGWDEKGASNIPELKSRISRYFLRRLKTEVLKDLPPKQHTDIAVDLSPEKQREYNLAVDSFRLYLKQIKKASDKKILKALQAEKLVKLQELRKITTDGKTASAIQTIQDIIDSGQKVVVFSVYNEPLEVMLKKFGKKAVTITGKTDTKERGNIVKKFQEDDSVQVFLGGTKSAGVGITLTSATNVLFLDYSWVPADHEQAEDRIHRIGQMADVVNIYQLYSKGTIDDYMRQLLSGKKKIFNQLIEKGDIKTPTHSTHLIRDLVKMIEEN